MNIEHYIRRDNYYLVGFAVVFGYLKKCLISFFFVSNFSEARSIIELMKRQKNNMMNLFMGARLIVLVNILMKSLLHSNLEFSHETGHCHSFLMCFQISIPISKMQMLWCTFSLKSKPTHHIIRLLLRFNAITHSFEWNLSNDAAISLLSEKEWEKMPKYKNKSLKWAPKCLNEFSPNVRSKNKRDETNQKEIIVTSLLT